MTLHLLIALLSLFLLSTAVGAGPSAPSQLLVEYLPSPVLGLDVAAPRFTWTLQHTERGVNQSAYQIYVSKSPSVSTGDVWDSGKVASSQSTFITYKGATLLSDTSYYWKVRWWDSTGADSAFSDVARFDTGFFSPSDWKGKWIGGFNMLRKEFTLSSGVSRARLFLSGIGYSEVFINGAKVGDASLDPGWTSYPKRSLYTTYDVTTALKSGANAVGVLLGNGWYGQGWGQPYRLLLQLSVETTSGSVVVVSDETWKGTAGPITYDSVYNGETYDSRMEQVGWDSPTFNDNRWSAAKPSSSPGGIISAQLIPQIKLAEVRKVQKITQPKPGVFVYDFGQNWSGWCKLTVKGENGTRVQLRHAEFLNHDGSGNIDVSNLRSAKATDVYILHGAADGEVYTPRFTYHGFRFAEITGFPGTPTADNLESHHLYSSVPRTGSLTFSHDDLNQVQSNIIYGQQSNLMSVPTDCDQRDERLGWMADAQLSATEAIQNFGMGSLYSHFLQLMRDDQGTDGSVTDVVPYIRYGSRPADPAWGAAYPLIAWWLYEYYGDIGIIQKHYEGIKGWIDLLTAKSDASGLAKFYCYYGDWVPPPPAQKCSCSFTAAFYYLLNVRELSEMARLIGNTADATKYAQMYQALVPKFNSAFYSNGKYDNGVQTTMALPLYLGLAVNTLALENALLNDVAAKGNHFDTGIIGTKYIVLALSDAGRTDVALKIATEVTYPSWAYEFHQDIEAHATTLWELWDSPNEGPGMNSRNHIMFGSISSWFYRNLAGLTQAPSSIGFASPVIAPPDANVLLGSVLTSVSGSLTTPYGVLSSSWTRTGGFQCRESSQYSTLKLSCGPNGGTITRIEFASFGSPLGDCEEGYVIDESCHAPASRYVVETACLGKEECEVEVHPAVFGVAGPSCSSPVRRLHVQAVCAAAAGLKLDVVIPINTDAEVHVNKLSLTDATITEGKTSVWANGKYIPGVPGIKGATERGNEVIFSTGSGSYSFSVSGTAQSLSEEYTAKSGGSVVISCPNGYTVSHVKSASYGTHDLSHPLSCQRTGSTKHVVERLCLGNIRCVVPVNDATFDSLCSEMEEQKEIKVQVYCS